MLSSYAFVKIHKSSCVFLLTGYKGAGYNIHVIGKSLVSSVHRTCLLKVLVICLRAGFMRSKQCSLLER